MSVHKLGARYIWQVMHGGTLGELGRLKGQVMEWYVWAQDARRRILHVR